MAFQIKHLDEPERHYQTRGIPRSIRPPRHAKATGICNHCYQPGHGMNHCPELQGGPNEWRRSMGQTRWSDWMAKHWWSVGHP